MKTKIILGFIFTPAWGLIVGLLLLISIISSSKFIRRKAVSISNEAELDEIQKKLTYIRIETCNIKTFAVYSKYQKLFEITKKDLDDLIDTKNPNYLELTGSELARHKFLTEQAKDVERKLNNKKNFYSKIPLGPPIPANKGLS